MKESSASSSLRNNTAPTGVRMNLQDHLSRYVELVRRADTLFSEASKAHPDLMRCKSGCDDCCSVYFELALIEAVNINRMFHRSAPEAMRARVLARARETLPLLEQAEEHLQRMKSAGNADANVVIEAAGRLTLKCPLNEHGRCVLYEHRPITCRLYGVPQKVGERTVTCPRSGFDPGARYQTVNTARMQQRLAEYSAEFLRDLLDVSVPRDLRMRFPMARVLTASFDKEYFLQVKSTLS